MHQVVRKIFLLAVTALVFQCVAIAQQNAQITGIVTDINGAVLPGVAVTVTDTATGITRSTTTSSTGLYTLQGLNPATYELKVVAKGFQTLIQTGLVLNISSTLRADAQLNVGGESQTVTVVADALQ